jgi:hypothetical protein
MKCYKLTTSWVTNTLIQFSACVLFFKSIFLPIDYHLNTFLPSDRLSSKHIPFLPIDYHQNTWLLRPNTIQSSFRSTEILYFTSFTFLPIDFNSILYFLPFDLHTKLLSAFCLSAFCLSAFCLSAFCVLILLVVYLYTYTIFPSFFLPID